MFSRITTKAWGGFVGTTEGRMGAVSPRREVSKP
jgi:hypothetical protein